MLPIRPPSADRPCHVRTTSSITIHRARTLQVRLASPLFTLELFYIFHHFLRLLLRPSGHSLGRVVRRLEWIEVVVPSVGLTIELSLYDFPPTWMWTRRSPRLTLLGALLELQRRRTGRLLLVGTSRSLHHSVTLGYPSPSITSSIFVARLGLPARSCITLSCLIENLTRPL